MISFKIIAVRPGFGYVTVFAGGKARLALEQPGKIVGGFKAHAVGYDLHGVVLGLEHLFGPVYAQVVNKFNGRISRLFLKITYKVVRMQVKYAAKLAHRYILA